MYTRKYNFTAEEMSCRNCTEYLPGGSCKKGNVPTWSRGSKQTLSLMSCFFTVLRTKENVQNRPET